jgi:hypothetical protein
MDISSLFRLNAKDFARGAITAVFVALVAFLWKASQAPNFDILALDWHGVLNAAVYGFIGYIGKNFLSDDKGKFLGAV